MTLSMAVEEPLLCIFTLLSHYPFKANGVQSWRKINHLTSELKEKATSGVLIFKEKAKEKEVTTENVFSKSEWAPWANV